MWSSATAVLWASWRLTRRELAYRLLVVTMGGAVLLTVGDEAWGPSLVLALSAMAAGIGTSLISRMDGPARFPLPSAFAQPVQTSVLVGVPMAYSGVTCGAIFILPLAVLGAWFDVPFPLVPVGAAVATIGLIGAAGAWWTSVNTLRHAGHVLLWLALMLWYLSVGLDDQPTFPPERWPVLFAFTARTYGLMALAAAGAFAIAIAGMGRQRRGDDWVSAQGDTTDLERFSTWRGLAAVRRVPCPVSSPTAAQVWIAMHGVGVPVLAAGLGFALATPLLAVVASFAAPSPLIGAILVASVSFFGTVVPLIVGVRGLLGLRRRPGLTGMSLFQATTPMRTARFAAVRVLVTAGSVFVAWLALAAALVLSIPIVFSRPVGPLAALLVNLANEQLLPVVVVAIVLVVALIGWIASGQALHVLYGWRVVAVGIGLPVYLLGVTSATDRGWLGEEAVVAPQLLVAHAWAIAIALTGVTIVAFGGALATRSVSGRMAAAALTIWAVAVAVFLWRAGLPETLIPNVPGFGLALLVSGVVFPAGAFALAPWTLSLIRHR